MRAGKIHKSWGLALVFLALAAGALALFSSYGKTELEELSLFPGNGGWECARRSEDGGREALTPEEAENQEGTVYFSRRLDPAWEEAGFTFLRLSMDWQYAVYLDGELLYTTAPGAGQTPEEAVFPADAPRFYIAGESVRLSLPAGYGGKTLTLAAAHLPSKYSASLPMVMLGNEAVSTALTATTANSLMAPAAAYMTAAFLLLGLLLYGGLQGRWDLPMLLLAAAASLQALYQLREYSFQLPYHAALDLPAAALIPSFFVALPLGYLLCRMGGRRRRLRAALVLAPAAVSLIPGVCSLLSVSLPDGAYGWCMGALGLSVVAALVYAALEARAGNRVFRLFWAGLAALCGALAAACLFSPSLVDYTGSVLDQAARGLLDTPLYWCGAAFFVLCAALSVEEAIRRAAESRSRADTLSVQVSALQGRVEATHAAEEAMRIERHDMRHQLQVVAGMVEKGERAEALAFIGSSQERLDVLKPERWCQNPVLDAVFSSYLEQAKRQGIRVEASLALPETLPVDALELSAVFANALENAIHACADVPEDQRQIKCKCLCRPQLMFEVANTYAGKVRFDARGLPVATRQGHGLGARSIAAFCEKHGAVCSYEAKDGWFRIRVAL